MYQQRIGRQPACAGLQKTRKNASNIWFFPRALLRHKLRHDESQERTKLLLAQSTVDGRLRVAPPSPQLDIFVGMPGLIIRCHSLIMVVQPLHDLQCRSHSLTNTNNVGFLGWPNLPGPTTFILSKLREFYFSLTQVIKCCVNHLV